MSSQKVYKELLRIIDLARDKVDDKIKEELSSNYGHVVIDHLPKGLPLMEDVVRDYLSGEKYVGGETILCSARVGDLLSDPTYNRPDVIDYNKCTQNVRKVGGYSNNAADILSGFLRPTGQVPLTKGNHRATMRYLCGLDPDVRVALALKLHKLNITLEEMVVIESKDHNRDCSYRVNQKGDSKFKSAYYAEEEWAENLYTFAAKYSIGIAGTLPDAKFILPSHSYLSRARKRSGDSIVGKYLQAFTENDCSKQIFGNSIIAGAAFLQYFGTIVSQVDEKYHCDSFSEMLDFYLNKRAGFYKTLDPDIKNLTQEQITDSSAVNNSPGNELGIARYVFLYNEFCKKIIPGIKDQRYVLKENANTVIPFNGSKDSEWSIFLEDCDGLVRSIIHGIATQPFF